MGIALGRRRYSPGSSANIDRSHPLAAGLLFVARSDSAQGRTGGAGISFGQTPTGKAVQSSDTTSAWATQIPRIPTMTDWTIHGVLTTTTLSDWCGPVSIPWDPQNTSWATPFHSLGLLKYSNTTEALVVTNDSGTALTYHWASGYILADSLPHTYTGVWGTQGAEVYRDGVLYSSDATTPNGSSSVTPSVTGTPETCFCGRSASTPAEGQVGSVALQAVWTRRLSAVEVSMLHADPYQLFTK